ncbi:hypothetical protein [Corynebacterium sp. CCM 9204]|uniref:hypothetical protein n=1 Tax=Corynebacterium sp. CCM 9204 TaxID=3057616 RepID=UPI003526230A
MTTNPMSPRCPRISNTDARAVFAPPTDERVKLTIRISENPHRDLYIQFASTTSASMNSSSA